jgi:hypothetical protein
MGLLTFALNVTLDGCCDHREMVANDEMLRYWTHVMDATRFRIVTMVHACPPYGLPSLPWSSVRRRSSPRGAARLSLGNTFDFETHVSKRPPVIVHEPAGPLGRHID